MIILQFLFWIVIGIIVLLVLAYFLRPELLTFPYTKFISLFVDNQPFVDKDTFFPDSKILEKNWEAIRDELLEVLKYEEDIPKFHEVDDIQRFIADKDKIPWRTFGISAFGNLIQPNASKVPVTTDLLGQIGDRVTLAMFSILDGGKHIPRHFGFFRGVFRYHLGLIVPENAPVYIMCGGERYDWEEGEGVLFDDTYMHEVWNKSPHRRVVLFLDIYRDKSLPKWLRPLNRKMYNLLANSERFKKAAKRAEVHLDIATES